MEGVAAVGWAPGSRAGGPNAEPPSPPALIGRWCRAPCFPCYDDDHVFFFFSCGDAPAIAARPSRWRRSTPIDAVSQSRPTTRCSSPACYGTGLLRSSLRDHISLPRRRSTTADCVAYHVSRRAYPLVISARSRTRARPRSRSAHYRCRVRESPFPSSSSSSSASSSSSSASSASRSRRPRPGSTPEVYAGRNAPFSSARSAFPPPRHTMRTYAYITPSRYLRPRGTLYRCRPCFFFPGHTRHERATHNTTGSPPPTTRHDRHTTTTEDVGKTERARAGAHAPLPPPPPPPPPPLLFALLLRRSLSFSLYHGFLFPFLFLLVLSPSLLSPSFPSSISVSRSAASLASCKLINRYLGAFYYIYIYARTHTHARRQQ